MSCPGLTPAQERLINYVSANEIPTIKQHLNFVFQAATFESELAAEPKGREALFTLYAIMEALKQD